MTARSPSMGNGRRIVPESYFTGATLKNRHTRSNSASHETPNGDLVSGPSPAPMRLSMRDVVSPAVDDSRDDLSAGAPPSPSTLTDIILTLHASMYGAKRSVDEIREVVDRYYERDAGMYGA